MAGGIPRQLVAGAILAVAALTLDAAGPPNVLVSYSFDAGIAHTGPDTFSVYQNAKGGVSLSSAIRYSGYQSVEIRDDPRDPDFPELQGYFPLRETGVLYVHFAMLVTDPAETLNIALAGPDSFRLGPDGIAFWLAVRKGRLYHYSDSIPRKLFQVSPFSWYIVDILYDVERGVYDLRIAQEGAREPLVDLSNQTNASNQAGSRVDKFSFIGDRGQGESAVVYYVDDIIVGTAKAVDLAPFVAPGRRHLFFDMWEDYMRRLRGDLHCLPALYLPDLGMSEADVDAVVAQGGVETIKRINRGRTTSLKALEGLPQPTRRWAEAIFWWKEGCRLLNAGAAKDALHRFGEALSHSPNARLFRLSEVLALAEKGDWTEVDLRLAAERAEWLNDPRFSIAIAMIGFARNETADPRQWNEVYIEQPELMLTAELRELLAAAGGALPAYKLDSDVPPAFYETVAPYVQGLQYYYHLLWRGRNHDAYSYALSMVDAFQAAGISVGYWWERAADAAFLQDDYTTAIEYYRRALRESASKRSVFEKLSDVYFKLGDRRREREYREAVYGTLYPG